MKIFSAFLELVVYMDRQTVRHGRRIFAFHDHLPNLSFALVLPLKAV
jgi:hypothetical protein